MCTHLTKDIINDIRTPAYLYDKHILMKSLSKSRGIFNKLGWKFLYPLKSCSNFLITPIIAEIVDGFSCSSLFECKIAKSFVNKGQTIHFTSPGIKQDEILQVADISDYISFNSINQYLNFTDFKCNNYSSGIRINPQLSLVADKRYDPCCRVSKLGVPLNELENFNKIHQNILQKFGGIHFHNNCDSLNINHLVITLDKIIAKLGHLLESMMWINLGGGYLWNEMDEHKLYPLYELNRLLINRYNLHVFVEPGATIVRESGFLISEVLDIFSNNNQIIAVLDTSINHMPEIFEYQYTPDILEENPDGNYRYLLAGCSCLAGDIFGYHSFLKPLKPGMKITFCDIGAYAQVKANMFNGIKLPNIYLIDKDGSILGNRTFDYNHCKYQNMGDIF